MAEKRIIDWEGIEREYRAGILSLREIGECFGLTHAAIRKRAERDGWSRDLAAKIRAKAEALVSKDAVSAQVSADTKATENQIVEANAQVLAAVDRRHKSTSGKTLDLVDKLIAELEATTENIDLFYALGEMMDRTEESESGRVKEDKLNKLYHAVISMGGRVDALKKLGETFERVAKFQRLSYKLEDAAPPSPQDESLTPERTNEALRRFAFLLSRAAAENT